MKLDIKIYGITDRIEQINKNKEILNLSDDDLNVIEKDGKWVYPLMKETWLKPIPSDITHRLVLQDDAELCPNFLTYVNQAINSHPDDIIFTTSLDYKVENEAVNEFNGPYVFLDKMVQGCSIIIPVKYIDKIFKYAEMKWEEKMFNGIMHEDAAIVDWARCHKVNAIITVPALTQHIGDHSMLFDYNSPTRAYYFSDWDKFDYTNTYVNEFKKFTTFKAYKEYKADIKIYGIHKREENIRMNQEKLGLTDDDIFFDERDLSKLDNTYFGVFNQGRKICLSSYTAYNAWNLPHEEGITHRVCLQDDVELSDNFKECVQRMINAHPDAVITLMPFYFGLNKKGFQKRLKDANSPYVRPFSSTGPGIIIPLQYVPSIFEFQYVNEWQNEDVMIREWCLANKIPYITTIPSILNHIGDVSTENPDLPIRRNDEWFQEHAEANWESKTIVPVFRTEEELKKGL